MLSQPSIRDSFRSSTIQKSDVQTLVDQVISSLKHNQNRNSPESKEVLVRFLAHICYCKVDIIPNPQIGQIIRQVTNYLSKPPAVKKDEEQPQMDPQKLIKASLNCLSNIYSCD